ncbi:MAG: Wzz/FepE/Etk N-terminal domain-containing protein [Hyphomonadaceae bacterium]
MSVETWTERAPPSAPDRPAAPTRVGRAHPKLGVADMLLQLWRAKWLMLLVFALIVLIGLAATFLAPTKYAASTRLLVRLGQEYVFDPVIGEAGKGAFPQQEEVLQAETELASSPVIAERVIKAIGLSELYPRLAEAKLRARDGAGYVVDQGALEAFAENLDVKTTPKSSILHMTFAHENPELAAATLNRFVTEYLKYRQEVFSGQGVQGLSDQRKLIEERLAVADKALQDYLAQNHLSDFEAEHAAATKQLSDITDERVKVEASLREAEAKSAGLARQMGATPREVDLYVETTSEQELVKLKLEREDLLTRYLPDSRAVKDVDRKIAQMQGFLATAPNQGLRRIGPNPTWQALEADRAVQTATISALNGRAAALARQKQEADQRIVQLGAIQPDYQRLKRDRDALETSAAAYASREQSELARSELASRSVDNITVYEAARAPTRGDSTKRTIVIAAVVFGLLTALAIGLLRAWSAAGFATAASVERTFGVRVLASVRER